MELRAVIEALKNFRQPVQVKIVTDSRYVIDIAAGRKRAKKNKALWQEYFQVASEHNISWEFVAGHSDNEYNTRCDKLAVAARDEYRLDKADVPQIESRESVASVTAVYLATKLSTRQKRTAWAANVIRGEQIETVAGVRDNATKYEALLHGAIRALSQLNEDEGITVHSTEKNFINSINDRVDRWQKNNWQYMYQDEAMPVKHKELWQRLLRLKNQRMVKFTYSKELRKSEQYIFARKLAEFLLRNTL